MKPKNVCTKIWTRVHLPIFTRSKDLVPVKVTVYEEKEWQEFQVVVSVAGKTDDRATRYAPSKEAALEKAKVLARRFEGRYLRQEPK